MPVEPRPAATVLALRDSLSGPEVFMVRRHERAAFMPGACVFPGGAVDGSDRDAALISCCDGVDHAVQQTPDLAPDAARAFHVAAVRELFEEAGVLLARDESGGFVQIDDEASRLRYARHRLDVHAGTRGLREVLTSEGLRLALDTLVAYAHWVTPSFDVRRFDTRFYLARLPPGQQPAQDDSETFEGRWTRAADALAAAARRELLLPPPTWAALRELEPFESVDAILRRARSTATRRREPTLVERDGQRWLVVDADHQSDACSTPLQFLWTGDRWEARPEAAGRGMTS